MAAQIALAGQALWSASVAARAGARAELVGRDGGAGGAASAAAVDAARGRRWTEDGGVAVRVAVPRLLPGLPRVMVGARSRAGAWRWLSESGQASVELVAALPALLLAALVALQLLAAGYALTLADGAAEAGALALASGASASEAARDALPGWAKDDVEVTVSGARSRCGCARPRPSPRSPAGWR